MQKQDDSINVTMVQVMCASEKVLYCPGQIIIQ